MANYININGNNIPIRASDPTNPIQGEVWYNTTTNALKGQGGTATDTIATGGNLNTARAGGMSAGASINSAVYTTGNLPGGADSNATENYDGTTWTTGTVYPSTPGGQGQGNGPQTAAIFCSGSGNSDTNFYDGSTFSAQNPVVSQLYTGGMAGTQASAVIAGGINPSPPHNVSQEYDGTSWSLGGNYNQQRYSGRMCGTSVSDGLLVGGELNPPTFNNVESYNGSTWASETAMPSVRAAVTTSIQSPASGEAVVFGGYTAPSGTYLTSIIKYDGAAWTTSPANLTTPYARAGGAGTSASSLIHGGKTGLPTATGSNITNEFIGAGAPTTVTFSSS
jgi:hypothetical protein